MRSSGSGVRPAVAGALTAGVLGGAAVTHLASPVLGLAVVVGIGLAVGLVGRAVQRRRAARLP